MLFFVVQTLKKTSCYLILSEVRIAVTWTDRYVRALLHTDQQYIIC